MQTVKQKWQWMNKNDTKYKKQQIVMMSYFCNSRAEIYIFIHFKMWEKIWRRQNAFLYTWWIAEI